MAHAISNPPALLSASDVEPVGLRNPDAVSPFFLICDHAGNAVPTALNGLGLPQAELNRHIGIDIGILGVTERLSDLLDAPLVFQRYSRLVVECNRKPSSPDFVNPVSDGTIVPANADVDDLERDRRRREIFAPYHAEIVERLDARAAESVPTILVSMHSFTPSLLSRPFQRPWHAGLCYDKDRRFTDFVLSVLDEEPELCVGRNEPYGVDMVKDYSIPVHGEGRGLPYVEFEIRQDLIADAEGQAVWADRIAQVLRRAHSAFAGSAA